MHLLLKHIHFCGGMHQLFPCLQWHCQAAQHCGRPITSQTEGTGGKISSQQNAITQFEIRPGVYQEALPICGGKDHQVFTKGQMVRVLTSASHLKGRHVGGKKAKKKVYLV